MAGGPDDLAYSPVQFAGITYCCGIRDCSSAKQPLEPKHVRSIRVRLEIARLWRDLAIFNASWHAFIDRALYLPKEWTDDPDRLEATYVPADVGFATKPKLATRMIARAIATSVPFKWVAGDTVYGVGDIEQQLRRAGKGYVLGVSSAHVFRSWGKRPPVAGTAADLAGRGTHPTGSGCRREPESKDRGCTIGVILNWPILRPGSSTVQMTVCGHAATDPSSHRDDASNLRHRNGQRRGDLAAASQE